MSRPSSYALILHMQFTDGIKTPITTDIVSTDFLAYAPLPPLLYGFLAFYGCSETMYVQVVARNVSTGDLLDFFNVTESEIDVTGN
jgi:hypothetical protein